jgi:hypothetical protein
MTTDTKTNPTVQLYAGGLSLPTVITEPLFATVRIQAATKTIRDGRYYKTETQMKRYRSSRPASAVCIKINRRLNHGLVECEMI